MPVLNRHIAKVFFRYTAVALLALVVLFLFVNLLEELSRVGGGYNLGDAVFYIALTIPRTVYELFPLGALLGTILGLSLLGAQGELIALRAGGVSIWQIAIAVLRVGLLLSVAAVLVGELLVPASDRLAHRHLVAQHKITDTKIWLRDSDDYIYIENISAEFNLSQVHLYEFTADKKLHTATTADAGIFDAANGGWLLKNANQTSLNENGTSTSRYEELKWQTDITPETIAVLQTPPAQLSIMQLQKYIRHLAANRQQTNTHRLALFNKLLLPVSVAVLLLLALPFAFNHPRDGGMGRSMFIGIMLGLVFYIISRGLGFIALTVNWSPLLGATLPPLIFFILATWLIRRAA